jgi:hypothetical protein
MPLDDAVLEARIYLVQLQSTNLQNAKDNLATNAKELDIMKDFSTTTEVIA